MPRMDDADYELRRFSATEQVTNAFDIWAGGDDATDEDDTEALLIAVGQYRELIRMRENGDI